MEKPLLPPESNTVVPPTAPSRSFEALATSARTQTTAWRFYCLAVCTGIAGIQGAFWNNFGPIAQVVAPYYNWSDTTIALLSNWGPIGYFVAAIPTAWIIDELGLRVACICGAGLIFGGSACRVVHVARDAPSAALMHIGQIANALAGPVAMSVGPSLSAQWFAPNERTTTTAVVGGANYGLAAITFVVGPTLVPSRVNATMAKSAEAEAATTIRDELWRYMLGEAMVAALLLLASLALPRRPPFPPSHSATAERAAFRSGVRQLSCRRHPSFWCLAVCYGALTGFFTGWSSMLGPNMASVLPADVAEREAGFLGFWGALLGMVGGVTIGLCADRIGQKKRLLLVCCIGATAGFGLFAAFCSRLLRAPYHPPGHAADGGLLLALYVTSIVGTILINCTIPLFFEMGVESVFPVAEGLTTTTLTTMNSVGCFLFLAVLSLPGAARSSAWMNWACAAACAVAFAVILPLSEKRTRSTLDVDPPPAQVHQQVCESGGEVAGPSRPSAAPPSASEAPTTASNYTGRVQLAAAAEHAAAAGASS